MTSSRLVLNGLSHYWRTNLAVVGGVAVAVTVLAGALIVGDSVRGSLRDLVLQRLGRADLVIVSSDFFRTQLAEDLRADESFRQDFVDVTPMVAVPGVATAQESGRRASRVQVYGVDERFWRFHGAEAVRPPASREVLLSPALARDLNASAGTTVLVRVQRPSAIPLESLHGQKEDLGRTLRLSVREVLAPASLGEFSIQPQQGEVRAAFVPLARLQQDLEVGDRANVLLVSAQAATGAGDEARYERSAARSQHQTPGCVGRSGSEGARARRPASVIAGERRGDHRRRSGRERNCRGRSARHEAVAGHDVPRHHDSASRSADPVFARHRGRAHRDFTRPPERRNEPPAHRAQ